MPKIDGKGLVAGVLVWLPLMAMISTVMACVESRSGGSEDFFLYGLNGIGMLAPSYFVAAIFSK